MARPRKDNADYFSHDKDMRNDNKLKAVRRKFKSEGYAIWNMLLEHLTDCDFFEYEYNDLNIELLSGDFDIDPKLLKEIIDYFILLNLLVLEGGFIKSLQLIKRFDSLLSKRKRDNKRVIASENPQRRVKESKVKESKEYNNTIIYPSFEDFWDLYNKKVDKSKCLKKWEKLNQTVKEKIIDYLPNYINSTKDIQFRKNPITFLNNESWNNEIITNLKSNKDARKQSISELANAIRNGQGSNTPFINEVNSDNG